MSYNRMCVKDWPSHDIAIAKMIWCMAYTRGFVGGLYMAQ